MKTREGVTLKLSRISLKYSKTLIPPRITKILLKFYLRRVFKNWNIKLIYFKQHLNRFRVKTNLTRNRFVYAMTFKSITMIFNSKSIAWRWFVFRRSRLYGEYPSGRCRTGFLNWEIQIFPKFIVLIQPLCSA